MITVTFENGRTVLFDADNWNFANVEENDVKITKDGSPIAHINWSKVLCISFEQELTE